MCRVNRKKRFGEKQKKNCAFCLRHVFTQSKNVWKHIQLIIDAATSVIDILTKGEFTKVRKLNNNKKDRHIQLVAESRYFGPSNQPSKVETNLVVHNNNRG